MSGASIGGYLRRRSEGGAPVLLSPLLLDAGVVHGFSTRQGGVSIGSFSSLNFGLKGGDSPEHVRRNAERLAHTVGFDPLRLFRLRQIHGCQVVELSERDTPAAVQQREADALTTAVAGTAVGVATADCVPVLFAGRGAVGAAHAGWRGIVAGVLRATVERLQRAGEVPVLAAIGPCIGPCCYEVGPEVSARFEEIPGAVLPAEPRPHLDLIAAVRHSLLEAGLASEQISAPVGLCTRCQSDIFFSYRRDGDATGHHLSVVVAGQRGADGR